MVAAAAAAPVTAQEAKAGALFGCSLPPVFLPACRFGYCYATLPVCQYQTWQPELPSLSSLQSTMAVSGNLWQCL